MFGSGATALMISNEEINNIMKIVDYEKSHLKNLFIKKRC